jgi:hypothetical protein
VTHLANLPPERDLPPARQRHLRSRVLGAATGRARRRPVVTVPVLAGLVLATGAAAALVAADVIPGRDRPQPDVVALGDEALSPLVRDAGNLCLTHAREAMNDRWPLNERPTMVNYAEYRDRAVVIYRTGAKMIICTMEPTVPPSDELSSSMGLLEPGEWLPGPIAAEGATSTELDGGDVSVAGRVSRRVARVLLDDGAGNTVAARLADGTFAVVSDRPIRRDRGVLISYDRAGTELDRRPALDLRGPKEHCYADPTGRVVYGTAEPNCRTAERWQPLARPTTPE